MEDTIKDLKQDHGLISSPKNLQVTCDISVVKYKGISIYHWVK